MLEVTIARVIHDVQLNHVLQVPGPYHWSSKTRLLPSIMRSVHDCLLTIWHGKIVTHQRYIPGFSCSMPSAIIIIPSFNFFQQDQAGNRGIRFALQQARNDP